MKTPDEPEMLTSTSTNKRPHAQSSRRHIRRQNPSRGGPAILFTCEQGREKKCEREGLEMLNYYWETQENKSSVRVQTSVAEKASLEDELETLRARTDEKDSAFQVFDTGCKGTVVIMFTSPGCSLIPPVSKPNSGADHEGPEAKKARIERTGPGGSPPWDPIETVRMGVQDLVSSDACLAPGSRFVTRMIPIQATCLSNLDEIQQVVGFLLDRLLPGLAVVAEGQAPRSFGIAFKRRNCSHLKRDEVIEAVAAQVVTRTSWTVKLREPDFTVMIEICKTLCGISILPSSCKTVAPNFNLASLRANEDAASE